MIELLVVFWRKFSIDFCGSFFFGDYLFVVIDEYSRYFEVEIVRSIVVVVVIFKLDRIFVIYGIFEEVKSDNGLLFIGYEFVRYV